MAQLWATNTLGGYFYSLNLSNELRTDLQPMAKFRQFCDVKDASQQGKKKGETFTWDIVSNVATQGGALTETNTMPETNFTIRQGTLTITEYGNSVPYTGKLEDLGKFSVKEVVMKALRKAPGERHASAEAMAQEIARHLAPRPGVTRSVRDTRRPCCFMHRKAPAMATGPRRRRWSAGRRAP